MNEVEWQILYEELRGQLRRVLEKHHGRRGETLMSQQGRVKGRH